MGISKKELRRFSKKELLKIANENSIEVKKSLSKNVVVDILFKNKSIRGSLTAPPKRSGTPAQLAARKKFAERMKNKSKVEKKVEEVMEKKTKPKPLTKADKDNVKMGKRLIKDTLEPTASVQPTIRPPPKKQETIKQAKKIAETTPQEKLKQDNKGFESEKGQRVVKVLEEDNKTINKGKIDETKVKFGTRFQTRAMKNAQKIKRHLFPQKGTKAPNDTQTEILKKGLITKVRSRHTRAVEQLVSTLKTTDSVDRAIANKQAVNHKVRLQEAIDRAIHKEELSFNKDIVDIDNELGIEANNPLSKIAELLLQRSKERSKEVVSPQEPPQKEELIKEEEPVSQVFKSEVEELIKAELVDILLQQKLVRNQTEGNNMLKSKLVELVVANKNKTEKLIEQKIAVRRNIQRQFQENILKTPEVEPTVAKLTPQ